MISLASVTSAYGTPTMFVDVLSAAKERGGPAPPSLYTGIMGGAPCPSELILDVITYLNMKKFVVR